MPKRATFTPVSTVIDRSRGSSFPLGATVSHGGINFSVYSKNADAIELLLFEGAGDKVPSRTTLLDQQKNRTYHYWHVFVPNIGPGQIYGYRVHAPMNLIGACVLTLRKCSSILTERLLLSPNHTVAHWRANQVIIALLP